MDRLIKLSNQYGIPIIQDSAHAIGAKYKGQTLTDLTDFSCYSFQAIKSITTGDWQCFDTARDIVKIENILKKEK